MKEYFNTFKIIWKDIFFKIAGNLFPFYIGALILLLLEKDISRVIDNQSFILYSSTFLFSTLYLWYKTIDKKKNEILILLYFFMFACGVSGYMLGVNPFNQPGVEAYKKNMFALLEKPGFEKQTAELKARL